MTPEREARMRDDVYELRLGICCDDADLLFIALDQERARVAKLEQVAEAAREFFGDDSLDPNDYLYVRTQLLVKALAALEASDG